MRWLAWLFPSGTCSLCRRPIRLGPPWACTRCIERLPLLQPPLCPTCSRPLRGQVGAAAPGATERRGTVQTPGTAGKVPLACRFCRVPPPFRWAVHVGVYEGALQTHIQRLKFENHRLAARTLGYLLAGQVMSRISPEGNNVIVPVPLHARRLAARGYNQAALLAQAISEHCGVPIAHALWRQRETSPQARLSMRERRQNLRGAFRVTEPAAVRGRHVVLIDDVYTTGVTTREAALALLRAGAGVVGVACVAVTVADADMLS